MIELPLAFVGGLLGTAHCVGMCGPFAITIGTGALSWSSNLMRQLSYSAGRIFTYAFLGAIAGYVGFRISGKATSLVPIQAALSILAGCLLLWQGLRAAGWMPRLFGGGTTVAGNCFAKSAFTPFLTAPGWQNAFLAGLLTGFLPCGLLYAYLALAVSGGSFAFGMTLMIAFGAGTVPLMVVTGLAASVIQMAARRKLLKVAAVCVILTGVASIHRGVSFVPAAFSAPATNPTEAASAAAALCPGCEDPAAAHVPGAHAEATESATERHAGD